MTDGVLMRLLVRLLFVALSGAVLFGCAALAPTDPTIVEVRISAAEKINPGSAGDALPVPVRLYRLSSPTAFDAASFDEIYNHEMETLGGHLVGVTEFVLFPGQAEVITREFNERERHFGIVVAYKEQVANWRASTPVPPNQWTTLEIHLGPDGVTLSSP